MSTSVRLRDAGDDVITCKLQQEGPFTQTRKIVLADLTPDTV
jgi:hypothetical protein